MFAEFCPSMAKITICRAHHTISSNNGWILHLMEEDWPMDDDDPNKDVIHLADEDHVGRDVSAWPRTPEL